MCCDAPPPAYCGPGDAHSQQEWIWRRDRVRRTVRRRAARGPCGWRAHPSISTCRAPAAGSPRNCPTRKLIVIVRDPIDRAYSNWMHLWVDGLEPIPDFVEAWHAEDERVAAGWAPFWHYRRLGRYGEQLADLLPGSIASGCWCCATGNWCPSRPRRWTGSRRFIGVARRPARDRAAGQLPAVRRAGAADRGARPHDPGRRRGRPLFRPAGLAAGQPAATRALQHGGVGKRPKLTPRATDGSLLRLPATRHRASWKRCSASRSRTGGHRPDAAPSPNGSEPDTDVIRSCEPSGWAASK